MTDLIHNISHHAPCTYSAKMVDLKKQSSFISQFKPIPIEPPQLIKHERVSNFLKVPFQLEKVKFDFCYFVRIIFDSTYFAFT